MTSWTTQELNKVAGTDEIQVAGRRADGTLRKPVIVWVAALRGRLYVRPVAGRDAAWYRGTQELHEGHVRGGGIEKDVNFVDAPDDVNDALDAVYRAKYGRYPANIVNSIVTPRARSATLELVPR